MANLPAESDDSSGSETYVPPIAEMRDELASMRNSLVDEGLVSEIMAEYLDYKRDGNRLEAAKEDYEEYFGKASQLYALTDETLPKEVDKEIMDSLLKRLRDRTHSINTPKIFNKVDEMIQAFEKGDIAGMKSAFEQVKAMNQTLHEKINAYFKLADRIEFSRAAAAVVEYGPPQEIANYFPRFEESSSGGSSADNGGQAGTNETGESSKPPAEPSGTGENSETQSD